MLWVKVFHILFVTSWFAGLFYMPRILVNLAMENHSPTTERLLLMARKLYRFMTILAVLALIFGLWLWLGYGIGKGPGNDWLHDFLYCTGDCPHIGRLGSQFPELAGDFPFVVWLYRGLVVGLL